MNVQTADVHATLPVAVIMFLVNQDSLPTCHLHEVRAHGFRRVLASLQHSQMHPYKGKDIIQLTDM